MKLNKILVIPLALVLAFGAFGTASAQVGGPRVAIQLGTTGLTSPLVASSTDATVARLVLDTTGSTEPVRITSLPFILTTANGAVASDLYNCTVASEASLGTDLNTGVTLTSGLNNIVLNSPLVLGANTITTLALRCDVQPTLVTNGTYTFSMNTANLVATGATTGLPATVTVRGAVVVPPPVVVVPGLPTTGAGGEAARNLMVIFASVLVAGIGLVYAKKQNA